MQAYLHHNVFEAARNIWCSAGVRGLYRGFWPTLARDVPEIAIQFTLYERCADWWGLGFYHCMPCKCMHLS